MTITVMSRNLLCILVWKHCITYLHSKQKSNIHHTLLYIDLKFVCLNMSDIEVVEEKVELSTCYKRSSRRISLIWNWFGYKFVDNKLENEEFVYCTTCFFEDNVLLSVSIFDP